MNMTGILRENKGRFTSKSSIGMMEVNQIIEMLGNELVVEIKMITFSFRVSQILGKIVK